MLAGLEADEADDGLQIVLELQLAMLAGERHDIGEGIEPRRSARRAAPAAAGRRPGARATAPAAPMRARRPSPDGDGRPAPGRIRAAAAVAAERAQRLVGRRQVGGVGEAHDDHVGGGERARRPRASPRCP